MQFTKEQVSQHAAYRKDPAWFVEMRLRAFDALQTLPLPKPDKTKIDKWVFDAIKVNINQTAPEIPAHIEELWSSDENNVLVIYKDTVLYSSLTNEAKEKGVEILPIFEAMQTHSDVLEKHFMKEAFDVEEHRLTALHSLMLNSGVFVYVPKNVVLETPIQVVALQDPNESIFNHVLVVAEPFSRITYVENMISLADEMEPVTSTSLSEVVVGDGAHVTYAAIDMLAKGNYAYISRRANVGRNGRMEWANGAFGDSNTVVENTTNLNGEGAYGDAKTITVGKEKQVQNFTTKIVHFAKHTEGYILNHGVSMDEATSIFNGIGKIHLGASKSNAEQSSKVLMLSKKARGDANPMLLIDEHDVMAGHAASVGKVSDEDLYYLMSRGISRKEAERLIIMGFLAPVVAAIPVEKVRTDLLRVIERKIKR